MNDKLRILVNAHLNELGERSLRPDELEYALALEWREDFLDVDDELAAVIAEHCREWRRAPGMREAAPGETRRPSGHLRPFRGGTIHDLPPVPAWWRDEVDRIWARHAERRREMLAMFGLGPEGLPDAADVIAFLAAVAATETQEGDWLLLDVPLGYVEEADAESGESAYYLDSVYQPVWRGFHRPPPIDAEGHLTSPTPAERAREQKLSRLAETAHAVSDETGCSQAEAVVFLLCHEQPALPYVHVERSRRSGGYVITVRDRRIPAKDVASFYRFYRDLAGQAPRQPKEGPYLVTQFVEEQRKAEPGVSWEEIFERFEREHPGRYVSKQSFQQTYYAKRPSK